MIDAERVRFLKPGETGSGPVVYWMNRDQRAEDNWALLFAQELALEGGVALAVVFCLATGVDGLPVRPYAFMLEGLRGAAAALAAMGIPFYLLEGVPDDVVPGFVQAHRVGALVTDFHPLRERRQWREAVAERVDIPVYEVDAHNIVPCWSASPKREFAAYTMRPKLHRKLSRFLTDVPKLRRHPHRWPESVPEVDWSRALRRLNLDAGIGPLRGWTAGERAASRQLTVFVQQRLEDYGRRRNDPLQDGQSDLSPYLHFGQIAAQRVAWQVQSAHVPRESKAAFLEELIVRRELSDNYCYYTPDYDRVTAFPAWAQRTIEEHRSDHRPYLYKLDELEAAATHDDLWNAAQRQMVDSGKMHGYLRMYWAKKILEWTVDPEEALRFAIVLNDRYELDGRDANGYAGIAWSIGGVHDRAWGARPIFGKIRYMSYRGSKSKFDVEGFIARWVPTVSRHQPA